MSAEPIQVGSTAAPVARMGAVVLCRMSSKRSPAKILRQFGDRTLLDHVVARCQRVNSFRGRVIVATSDQVQDDQIAKYCEDANLIVYRGDLDNVAGRSLAAAQEHELDWFARVNGDSPCLEPSLLDEACAIAMREPLDFVTNLAPRSFPYGVSVELIRTRKYVELYPKFAAPHEHEHLTKYLYQNLASLRYHNLSHSGGDLSDIRLTIDTPEDVAFFEQLCQTVRLPLAEISFQQAVEAYLAMKANS